MSDDGLFLLVELAGCAVAIDAAEVGAVIEMAEVTPIPRVPEHIVGLYALRSRVLTVVDPRIGLAPTSLPTTGPISAVVLDIDGHSYALIVDEVIDVVTARPPVPPGAVLGREWSRIAIGRVTVGEEAILLVSPRALIEGPAALAA